MNNRPHAWFWGIASHLQKKQLDKFPKIHIDWDTSVVGGSNGEVLLEPGYKYTFSAGVSIWPMLWQPRFLPQMLEYFYDYGYKVNSNDITRVKLGYFEKHLAVVNMQVNFEPESVQIRMPGLTFDDLCVNVVAALGYFALGYVLLSVFQVVLRQTPRYHQWALGRQQQLIASS